MKPEQEKSDKAGLERIVFFSDAVIAIAMTLLVLDMRLPEFEAGMADAELNRLIYGLWPRLLAFVLSFWVIALYWISHHRSFRLIRRYDRGLIFLNLLFLMFVALMPVPISLLYEAPGRFLPVTLYAAVMAAMGFSKMAVWRHAQRAGLVDPRVSAPAAVSVTRRLLVTPGVFLVSIAVAWFNPDLAMYSWILVLPLALLARTDPSI